MIHPRNIELVLYKTYADLRAESERTYVGFFWWFFDPLIYMVVLYYVFAVLLNRYTEDLAWFLLIGLVPWKWYESGVMHAANSIAINAGLMRQIYLPKGIFPTTSILVDSIKFIFAFFVMLVFLWVYHFPINPTYFALPLVMATQLLFIAACGFALASIVPFLPDVEILISNILRILFFVSGVFPMQERLPDTVRFYFYMNPMAVILKSYRDIIMDGVWPMGFRLICISAVSVIIAMGGAAVIRRYDHQYPRMALR